MPQKEYKWIKNECAFCQHNSDVASMSKNILSDYKGTYLNIAEDKNTYAKHDELAITENINSSWSLQYLEEPETKKITRNYQSHQAHGNWRKLNKLSSLISSLTESEIDITELVTSTSPKRTKSTANSVIQILSNKIETKMSTIPSFYYKCKNNKTIAEPSSEHVKGNCSEYEICAELVYAESNKVLTPDQPETEDEHESTSQLNIIQTDIMHIKPTQEIEIAKMHTNDIIPNKDIKEDETFTNQSEKSKALSTHIINNTCFHNDEKNQTVLSNTEQCTNETNYSNITNSNNNSIKKVILSENLNQQDKESNAFCVKAEKEEGVFYSPLNSSCTSSLPASKNIINTAKEEGQCLSLESSQLLTQPSVSHENEELKIFSSAKMINFIEKSSLEEKNYIIDNDDECRTDDSKESCLTHSARSAASQNSTYKKEEESTNNETILKKCEEQPSLSLHSLANLHSSPSLLHQNSSSSTITLPLPEQESAKLEKKNVTNDNELSKCTNIEIVEDLANPQEQCQLIDNNLYDENKEGSDFDGENDLNNEYNPQSIKKNTNVVVQSVDNTVNIKANAIEHEVKDNTNNNNNGGDRDEKEHGNNKLEPLTHGIHNEEEPKTPIALTAPELVQIDDSSRLVQEHTLSQLWQLLQRGSILLKHIHCHRRPHKRFFNIQNVKCYFEGSKAVIPHLVWRSASRREIQKRMNSETKEKYNHVRNEQCTLQTPNDANENDNHSNTMSINDRKSVSSNFFCTSGNPFRSEHLLNLTTLESCEELNEETLQDETSVAHRLFATRHGCSVDDHWHEIPYSMCAIWTFTTRTLAVSFCNGDDHDLWQRVMNYIVCRNKQLFN